jgi:hypothetical protein
MLILPDGTDSRGCIPTIMRFHYLSRYKKESSICSIESFELVNRQACISHREGPSRSNNRDHLSAVPVWINNYRLEAEESGVFPPNASKYDTGFFTFEKLNRCYGENRDPIVSLFQADTIDIAGTPTRFFLHRIVHHSVGIG